MTRDQAIDTIRKIARDMQTALCDSNARRQGRRIDEALAVLVGAPDSRLRAAVEPFIVDGCSANYQGVHDSFQHLSAIRGSQRHWITPEDWDRLRAAYNDQERT